MKKNILFFGIIIFFSFQLSAQEALENCFECRQNSAAGYKSIASGLNNEVSGSYAGAFGSTNIVTGSNSFALGQDLKVLGSRSVLLGKSNESSGLENFIIGVNSSSTTGYGTVIGRYSTTSGMNSFSIGYNNRISGDGAFIMGSSSRAQYHNNVLIGHFLKSHGLNTFIIGCGAQGDSLTNYISNSLVVGFQSNLPTFFVGSSGQPGKTGKIGIGNVTNPLAKLHLKADESENATLRLESTGTGKTAGIEFGSGDKSITTADGEGLSFTSQANKPFRFVNGDIYLEDINQGIIMHSPDGNCWRGTLDNSGMLNFVPVDCEEVITNTDEKKQIPEEKVTIYPNPAGDKLFVITAEDFTGSTLEIYDLAGKLKYTTQIYHPETCIELDFCSSGTYILKILNKSGTLIKTSKIIKAE